MVVVVVVVVVVLCSTRQFVQNGSNARKNIRHLST